VSAIREGLRFAAVHPALPGHFPGKPVVAGVLLLDRAAAAIQREWQLRVTGIPRMKFVRPLPPETDAELQLERLGNEVRVRIVADGETIASGTLEASA